MKFVLFVEGHTEKKTLSGFLKRWLDPRLSKPIGVQTIRSDGWQQFVKKIAARPSPAADGRLTVPADILQGRLPSENEGTHSIHLGIDARPIVFTAPGMDYGTAQAGVSESRAVAVE